MTIKINPYVAKLTDQQVYQILYLYHEKNVLPCYLAPTFNVAKSTIRNIVNGKSRQDCHEVFLKYRYKMKGQFEELVTSYKDKLF
ncbi:hypothetical protein [Lysinibacillus irui]|uniref:Uncharacterized protein n=1 Tax=Lysinibacillus irui TaxID=2998077 RepID=A0AAJ5UVI9_9BACI|nr:hypothetical protein [Lysinibacillus irui]WDV07137.1 hypothetical protein OU989_01275 [Lysinibacillus irui]